MATFDPSAASRQLPFARGAMGLRESYAVAYVHRLVVGEGVLTLPLAVRREMAARCDGRVNLRFRRPRPKGGRGRPPLQLDLAGCEAYAAERIVTHDMSRRRAALCLRFPPSKGRVVEDADPYGWVVNARFRNHTPPSQTAAEWCTGDGAPYKYPITQNKAARFGYRAACVILLPTRSLALSPGTARRLRISGGR